jgi:hypothetical protein
MFGLRMITKREIALYVSTIADLREEVQKWQEHYGHERKRAEGAINALLIRSARIAITPDTITDEDQEKLREKQFDIFGDGQNLNEEETLEKLQS